MDVAIESEPGFVLSPPYVGRNPQAEQESALDREPERLEAADVRMSERECGQRVAQFRICVIEPESTRIGTGVVRRVVFEQDHDRKTHAPKPVNLLAGCETADDVGTDI